MLVFGGNAMVNKKTLSFLLSLMMIGTGLIGASVPSAVRPETPGLSATGF